MDISIPGYSRETISNVAYKDGRLHILFKTSQPGTGNNTWTALQHSGTKEGLRSLYSLSYDVDGVFYQESVYELEHLESLEDYVLHVEGDYYENAYEGKWQVRFDAPQEVTSVDLPVDGAPAPIKKVTVTPLSVVILNSGETSRDGFAVTLIYNDGTRKPLTGSDMYTYENGDQEWHYANAFLFQEIVAVEINGVGLDFPHDLLIASYEDAAKLDLEVSDFQISE
jgi:hypothetical protein